MKRISKEPIMRIANKEEQSNKNSISSEELIKRREIPNTPFTAIEIQGKHFGTFGKFKITEDYTSFEEVENELTQINWNRIVQIMTLVHKIINDNLIINQIKNNK